MRILSGLLCVGLTACITPSEKKDMKGDIFNVQTRLLNLERQLTDTTKDTKASGDSAAKRLASNASEIDRMSSELQKIRGEMDTLRVGVMTGQMPGVDPAQQENSLAANLAKMDERLQAVEESQAELLDALKKAGLAAKKKKERKVGGVDDLEKAYNDKKYKQVIEDGPKVMKDVSGDDKEQARFLVADSYFKLGKMREAALKFNEFLEAKPGKKYMATAKMRIGDCFRHLGDGATAKVYYEELIKEFPDSEEAAKAKERLAEKG